MTRLFQFLTYLGALPFVICAMALTCQYFNLPYFHWDIHMAWHKIMIVYSVVISSFIGGLQWGLGLREKYSFNLLLRVFWAVFMSLAGCYIIIYKLTWLGLVLSLLIFTMLLIYDIYLAKKGVYPDWFARLRLHVSIIAIICLLIAVLVVERDVSFRKNVQDFHDKGLARFKQLNVFDNG